jgi:hypothetical protein
MLDHITHCLGSIPLSGEYDGASVGNNHAMVCFRRVVLCLCLIGELKLPIVFDRGVEVADRV